MSPVLTSDEVNLQAKGKDYVACIRGTTPYGSETCAMTDATKKNYRRKT